MHPNSYQFIELLRSEHEFQHHKAEESQVQARKRKKLNIDIDDHLELLSKYQNGEIHGLELAIKSRRAVKSQFVKSS